MFKIRHEESPTDNRSKRDELRLHCRSSPEASETKVTIYCARVACRGIHRLHEHKVQRVMIAIKNVLEHHQKASEYMLGVSVLVMGADEHTIIPLATVEVWIASQVVGSQFPVHGGLVVHLEVSMFCDLLEATMRLGNFVQQNSGVPCLVHLE